MPKIHFIQPDKTKISVEAEEDNLMEVAIEHDIDGIENSCGGLCSCATCHVHIAKESMQLVGPATDDEKDILEFEDNVTEFSRLSCQIEITDKLDGLVVETFSND